MKSRTLLLVAALLLVQPVLAGSFVNTLGSSDTLAISGFDPVAMIAEKKAVRGKAENVVDWMGAKWLFSTAANMELFKSSPEKYAPQYGGHCTWGISENVISRKPFAGSFEVINGKLYLFAPGNSSADGARTSFWQSGGGPRYRLPEADKNWPGLKAGLESR